MRGRVRSGAALVVLAVAVAGAPGCKKDAPKEQPARPAAPAAAQPAPKPTPWYVGEWSGTYQASLFKIEMTDAEGAVKEWSKDDPSTFTGSGTLKLRVTEDHKVSGDLDGPLGNLAASGEVDGETLRVSLEPAAPAAADQVSHATLIATRRAGAFEGQLRASTGNSLKVRVAAVTLAKQPGPNQGAGAPAPSKR
jgi:hypothetical protein